MAVLAAGIPDGHDAGKNVPCVDGCGDDPGTESVTARVSGRRYMTGDGEIGESVGLGHCGGGSCRGFVRAHGSFCAARRTCRRGHDHEMGGGLEAYVY